MADIKKDTRDKIVSEMVKRGVDRKVAERETDKAIIQRNEQKKEGK
jgi:hypothetical protein